MKNPFTYFISFLVLTGFLYSCHSASNAESLVRNGYPAPDLNLPDRNGNKQSLRNATSSGYVLYDFWASWCAPCRSNNKTLVSWKAEGRLSKLEVISISLDTDAENWKSAIAADSLFWPRHYCDLSGGSSSELSKLGISNIPFSYLVNPDGLIMAVNPRLHRIEELIADQ